MTKQEVSCRVYKFRRSGYLAIAEVPTVFFTMIQPLSVVHSILPLRHLDYPTSLYNLSVQLWYLLWRFECLRPGIVSVSVLPRKNGRTIYRQGLQWYYTDLVIWPPPSRTHINSFIGSMSDIIWPSHIITLASPLLEHCQDWCSLFCICI